MPWHSPSVAVLANPKPGYNVKNKRDIHENPRNVEIEVEETSIYVWPRNILLKPRTQHHAVVTAGAHELKMIKHQSFSKSRQCTLVARVFMNVSSNRPFYIHTDVREKSLETFIGPDVDLDSTLCTSVLGIAQHDCLCRASFSVSASLADSGNVLLDDMYLPCSLNSDFL